MIDQNKASYVVNFIKCLKLTDDFYGKPFNPLPWQEESLREFYGTVKDNGLRQYQYLYL